MSRTFGPQPDYDDRLKEAIEIGHQPEDTPVRVVWYVGLGLAVLVVIVMIVLRFVEAGWRTQPDPEEIQRRMIEDLAGVMPHAGDDLRRLRQRDEEGLTTYGWINRDLGVGRIPIERAMELTVERMGEREEQ